ncbi:MAG TPA: hypothetical protein DEF45_14220 [Rhodopirellula sp.]|nr:hypothetical protein [Rhodopirellula sp.]
MKGSDVCMRSVVSVRVGHWKRDLRSMSLQSTWYQRSKQQLKQQQGLKNKSKLPFARSLSLIRSLGLDG